MCFSFFLCKCFRFSLYIHYFCFDIFVKERCCIFFPSPFPSLTLSVLCVDIVLTPLFSFYPSFSLSCITLLPSSYFIYIPFFTSTSFTIIFRYFVAFFCSFYFPLTSPSSRSPLVFLSPEKLPMQCRLNVL